MGEDFEYKIQMVIEQVHGDSRKQMEQEINSVLDFGISSLADLIGLLNDNTLQTNFRETICWLLSRLNYEDSVHALLNVLNAKDPHLRRAAAQALGEINVSRGQAVRPLIELLRDQNEEVRKAAVYGLGRIHDRKAVHEIITVLEDRHEPSTVRGMAAEALSYFDDEDAISSLIKSLGDLSPEVRFWAAYALGELQDFRAISELEKITTDKALVQGYGLVGEEALRAISNIQSHQIDDEE